MKLQTIICSTSVIQHMLSEFLFLPWSCLVIYIVEVFFKKNVCIYIPNRPDASLSASLVESAALKTP